MLFRAGLALSVTFGDTSPKGRGFGRPEGAKRPPFGDGAPGGGLSFWVSQWTHLLLPLSLLLYAILRKSQALCGKFTVTLLLASPVSFWRKEWYNGFAALPAHLFGRGGEKNGKYSFFYTFIICHSPQKSSTAQKVYSHSSLGISCIFLANYML